MYHRGTTPQRGYGHKHREMRKALLPRAIGTPCVRCGRIMHAGQDLDLDHSDNRQGYIGFSHAHCNRKAGLLLRRKLERDAIERPQPRSVTRW